MLGRFSGSGIPELKVIMHGYDLKVGVIQLYDKFYKTLKYINSKLNINIIYFKINFNYVFFIFYLIAFL